MSRLRAERQTLPAPDWDALGIEPIDIRRAIVLDAAGVEPGGHLQRLADEVGVSGAALLEWVAAL